MLHVQNILPEIDGEIEKINLGENRFVWSLWSTGLLILFNAVIPEYGEEASLPKFIQNVHKSKATNANSATKFGNRKN